MNDIIQKDYCGGQAARTMSYEPRQICTYWEGSEDCFLVGRGKECPGGFCAMRSCHARFYSLGIRVAYGQIPVGGGWRNTIRCVELAITLVLTGDTALLTIHEANQECVRSILACSYKVMTK